MNKLRLITLLALILSAGLVAGCDDKKTRVNGFFGYEEDCIKGVVYYKKLYMLAPAYKQDGTLYLCESN